VGDGRRQGDGWAGEERVGVEKDFRAFCQFQIYHYTTGHTGLITGHFRDDLPSQSLAWY